jgi:hypothetical protein
MRKLKSVNQARRFVTGDAAFSSLFYFGGHRVRGEHHRNHRVGAFNKWSGEVA